MDCVIDMDSARMLLNDPVLWPRVRDFLWNFTDQIHPTWLEDLNAEGRKLISSPRVKTWALAELGAEPCFPER